MRSFEIIVAVDSRNGMGKEGKLPWHLPSDMKRFKEITTQVKNPQARNAVIMGRRTWESLPDAFRPLPRRLNVVLTRNSAGDYPDDVLVSNGLESVFELLQTEKYRSIEKVFVIGGAQIFAEALAHPQCQVIHLTRILTECDCDVFLPAIPAEFKEKSRTPTLTENSLVYYFAELTRHAS